MSVLKVPSISEHHRSFSDITIVSGIMVSGVTVVSGIVHEIRALPAMVPPLLMVPQFSIISWLLMVPWLSMVASLLMVA